MNLEQIFSAATLIAVVGWLPLVFLPRQPFTPIISAVIAPLVLAGVYLYLIAMHMQGAEGGFGSLADVATLFQKPELLLAGWIHYLAFDLFIGAWEVRDAQRNQIPHLVVIPCLVMTFMLGPIGLLFYFAIRTAKLKAVEIV
ncbi:MAG TPA: ABA4-like family protein [Vicinamibacterales bacterium]|nr:ABA4-like family protein [Vicinamibacterales bacterium]